jgi:hypothetical protein
MGPKKRLAPSGPSVIDLMRKMKKSEQDTGMYSVKHQLLYIIISLKEHLYNAVVFRAAAIDYFSSRLVVDYFCRLVDERSNVLFSS